MKTHINLIKDDIPVIKEPIAITTDLLVSLEEFVVNHYINYMTTLSLLFKKRIISESEFLNEKKELEKMETAQELLKSVIEHKKIAEEMGIE